MDSNNISYIYKYENKINHKIYIGQSIDPKKRFREHKNAAFNSNNTDYDLPIHRAIRKYGLDNFDIVILEFCSKNQADEREKYWIQFYNSYNKGYNATNGGQDGGGYNGKEVLVYDLDGNFITSYVNAKEAAKTLGVSYSVVQQVLHAERPTCKQVQLKYADDDKIITKFKSRQGGKISIYQLDINSNIIQEWDSAADASKALGIDSSSITKCLKDKAKTCGGFKWKYKEA